MKVNFLDLKAQMQTIRPEIDMAIDSVLETCAFAGGKFVAEFESQFAEAHGAKFCCAVSSGTSALHLALWAEGIGHGDEVIVPTNTFFATAEAVSLTGAKPVFVDCDEKYYNIDTNRIEEAITDKTKAIIPVHLYGQSAEMGSVMQIAKKNNLAVIEDCAQAHLAEYKGTKVGTFGNSGCFSFYPGKNLGAYGDAGAVITNDEELWKKMCQLRDHGSSKKYFHRYVGQNYRMDGFQGAVLSVKLPHLKSWTESRRTNATYYRKVLSDISDIEVPEQHTDGEHSYHLFIVRTPRREELMEFLKEKGIFTGIHYPIPCHKQEAYTTENSITMECPIAEKYSSQLLSLPMFPELTTEEMDYVAQNIQAFFNA